MCPTFHILFFFELPMFSISLCFPFGKLSLAFLALVERKDVRHETAGDGLNLVLWNIGIVDELFSSTQVLSSV